MDRICTAFVLLTQVVGSAAADPDPKFPMLGTWESKELVEWKFQKPAMLPIYFWEGGKFLIAVGGSPGAYLLEEGTFKFLDATTLEAKITLDEKATVLRFALTDGELTTNDVTGKPLRFQKQRVVKPSGAKDDKPPPPPDASKPAQDRPPRVVPTPGPLQRDDKTPPRLEAERPLREPPSRVVPTVEQLQGNDLPKLPEMGGKDRARVSSIRPEVDKHASSDPPPDPRPNGMVIPAISGAGILALVIWFVSRRR